MNEKEKTTVPIPSVGADGEQSLSYEDVISQNNLWSYFSQYKSRNTAKDR